MIYKILVAEDDLDIANILRIFLESNGYQVITADNGEDALRIAVSEPIDLAILDIMMPKIDGFTVTWKLREAKAIPIIIITARAEDNDSILGLNLGADDYITKPFNPLVIVARVAAQLRRYYHLGAEATPLKVSTVLTLGELTLDTETLILKKAGKEIIITPNEYKLLSYFMKSPGRVFTKAQLCEAVNGEFYENYENAIMVHISHLREKIEDDPRNPRYIKNVRGLGYKIEKI